MSIFYRTLSLITLILALFMETTFDCHEITYTDRLCLFLMMFTFNILAKLEDMENLLKEFKNKNT